MKKKLMAVLVAAGMVISMAACGGASTESQAASTESQAASTAYQIFSSP